MTYVDEDNKIKDFFHERFRRTDTRIDALAEQTRTANRRLTSIEERLTNLEKQESQNAVVINDRFDILQRQLDTITEKLTHISGLLGLRFGDTGEL